MSQLLSRGYNVSVPEVDLGDDVLVEYPEGRKTKSVQVKSRTKDEPPHQSRTVGRFIVPTRQLLTRRSPELCYVFAVWIHGQWDTLIISRRSLLRAWLGRHGRPAAKKVTNFAFTFHPDRVHGLGRSFNQYRNNWDRYWPRLTRRPGTSLRPRNARRGTERSNPNPDERGMSGDRKRSRRGP